MREIRKTAPDPAALKALTHPHRLRILGILRLEGPSTATALAAQLTLNSGATSYHLRQLAAWGYIEEATDLGNARDRWWRAAHESTVVEEGDDEPRAGEALQAYRQAVVASHARQLQRAQVRHGSEPAQWRKASTVSDFTIPLTAEAAQDLVERIMALLWEVKHASPEPGAPLPADVRQMTFHLHSFPHPGHDGEEDTR